MQSDSGRKTDLKMEMESSENVDLKTISSKKDTIRNYWELMLDTISSKKEFKIFDIKYSLELKTFSLNDSSIVRNLMLDGEHNYLDHSHKIVTDLTLLSKGMMLDRKQIDRTDFKESLNAEFYADCNLLFTEIDSIGGPTVYLTSDMNIPDSGNQWRVWYSIKMTDNRIGPLQFEKSEYVGM